MNISKLNTSMEQIYLLCETCAYRTESGWTIPSWLKLMYLTKMKQIIEEMDSYYDSFS